MARVFISYRRQDSSDVTGRIYDRLAAQFGKENVFKDVDSIPLGVDFRAHLNAAVSACDVVLAVIGPDWAGSSGAAGGSRLMDERDFVRAELEGALCRDMPVVPLLVRGAPMPQEHQLPSSLRELCFRNGMPVRADPDFHRDMERLIKDLTAYVARNAGPACLAEEGDHSDAARAASAPRPLARRSETLAVGIDLGTTFSVLSYLNEYGQPVTALNAEGDRLTPSAVYFGDDDEVAVGREAIKGIGEEADRVAHCVKRDMHVPVYHKALNGKQYPPQVLQAFVLNKLRVDARAQIGTFAKAVITVPAYFDEVGRKATQEAGYMAGLDVIDIINEPTAAAIAFGYQQGFLSPEGAVSKPRRIMVCDLGGGTFDVTIMELRDTDFKVLAIDGDVRVGGYDWDQRLIGIVADRFLFEHGEDPREDPISAAKLWRDCEEAKRTLSVRGKTVVSCDHHGESSRIAVTRKDFEEASQDLLDRCRFTSGQTLKSAGLQWSDLDHVLLVGGATRMPAFRQMIRDNFGKEADSSLAADEAVAQGAALYAGYVLAGRQGRKTAFSLANVNSRSLGIVAIDPQTGRNRNAILIPRNTPLPCQKGRTFRTRHEGQRSVGVRVLQGENPSPDDCTELGALTLSGLPAGLPAGTKVRVRFCCEPDGRLKVAAEIAATGIRVNDELHIANSLSRDHLDGWRKYISGLEPDKGLST